METFGDRPTWDNETLWNYEVGTKSTILGGRGTVNVSGFYMDIRNLQATVTAGSCSSRVIFNVPDARSAGLEVEVAAQPTPLFDVALSASVADARLQSTLESYDAAGHVTGIIAGIEDGKRLPTTPRFQMAVAATWRWVMGGRVGYLSGVYQHVGSRFTQIGDQAEGFGSDAPICQDTPSGGLDDLLTSAEVGHDALVNLSREEAFQAADDVAFGPASGDASGDVVAGRLVELHPDDDGSIEGRVGVSVAASIEAVPTGGHPRRGRDRAGAAELREGGLRTNPVGVIAEDDQQLSRGVGAHTEALAEGRCCRGGETREVLVVQRDFLGESHPPTGERSEGVLGGRDGPVDGARSESGAAREQAVIGEIVEGFSQDGRGLHDDLLQRVHRRGARFHGGIPCDLELADHLDGAVRGLGDGRRLPREQGPRRHLGVDGVGLAGGAACTAVAPIHFHDMMPGAVDGPCQASAVAPGAFDPERLNPPVCLGPRDQSLVATRVRDERVIAQTDPPAVDCHRDVDMLMRINTDDHRPRFGRRSYAVGHGLASSDCGPELVRAGGQDCDGPRVQQAPIGSRPIRSAGCRTSCQRAMTDRSVARTVGQSS